MDGGSQTQCLLDWMPCSYSQCPEVTTGTNAIVEHQNDASSKSEDDELIESCNSEMDREIESVAKCTGESDKMEDLVTGHDTPSENPCLVPYEVGSDLEKHGAIDAGPQRDAQLGAYMGCHTPPLLGRDNPGWYGCAVGQQPQYFARLSLSPQPLSIRAYSPIGVPVVPVPLNGPFFIRTFVSDHPIQESQASKGQCLPRERK